MQVVGWWLCKLLGGSCARCWVVVVQGVLGGGCASCWVVVVQGVLGGSCARCVGW